MSHREHWMNEALAESAAALPACRPNPPVGCVIVQGEPGEGSGKGSVERSGEHVVARGFTGPPGTPHAEAAALANLPPGIDRSSLTLYVTLEPCSFRGRTPSCALALIESGIPSVVVATVDPHPRNRGLGLQMMRDAGITVELGVLEDRVLDFIAPYLLVNG
jgi:pyrimidine deaminase RibD-like protein